MWYTIAVIFVVANLHIIFPVVAVILVEAGKGMKKVVGLAR